MVLMDEETKSIGTDGEKSERLHSTEEAGEPTQGTRSREGGRRVTEPVEGKKAGQPGLSPFSTGLDWVAEVARRRPNEALTTLAHHITPELLREAYRRTRKDGAAGVDGQTAEHYEQNLEGNLKSLHERFRSATYVAPPVRRVHIPKGDGSKTRPIGIPTLEDKVLQRAVVMVLERIYEQEFRDCSYGFRPHRSAHQALKALRDGVMEMKGGVVIEVDIQGFFDSLDHGHLRSFLDTRVRDGLIRRMIDKWIKAGVLEDGQVKRSTAGTPQGGVISPLLANVYLHHVLDAWFEDEVRPRLRGRSLLVRYADDAVIVLENETDAQRVMAVLPKRFEKYGLTLHPEKTRQVPFKRPPLDGPGAGGGAGDFDFLGFTHHWGKSRKGNWVVRQKTSSKSLKRVVATVRSWLQRVRHWRVRDQHEALCLKLKGHDSYYGLTGNWRALRRLRQYLQRCWRQALNRRDQGRAMGWSRFSRLLTVYPLPPAHVVHAIGLNAASP